MRYDVARHNAERIVALPNEEVARRYLAGETIAELAAAFGVSRPTIGKALKATSTPRRAPKQRKGKLAGDSNPAWAGGRRIRPDGYVVVWFADGEQLEHRAVMSMHLGRALLSTEVVHHRDGNKQNNDPANLQLMTQSEHARLHAEDAFGDWWNRG